MCGVCHAEIVGQCKQRASGEIWDEGGDAIVMPVSGVEVLEVMISLNVFPRREEQVGNARSLRCHRGEGEILNK